MTDLLDQITIRRATADDAEGTLRAHNAAVRTTAASHYSQNVIDNWAAKLSSDSINSHRNYLETGQVVAYVAEIGGEIAGFSELVPESSELRAVYVHPRWGRRGVGTMLLAAAESEAKERDLSQLELVASLNAQEFYRKHGYEALTRTKHVLSSGAPMDCVKMLKTLNREIAKQLDTLKICAGIPSPQDYNRLRMDAGWDQIPEHVIRSSLKRSLCSVCGSLAGSLVAYGRIIGDGGIYFYIQDVIVEERYRGLGYGHQIMDRLLSWWDNRHGGNGMMMLMAAQGKAGFYERYGFRRRDLDAPGMIYSPDPNF